MSNEDKKVNIRENSLASIFEINELIKLFNNLDEDETLNYSIISKMIDFITDFYYNKDKADVKVIEFLVNLYMSHHVHIREKINKALMKLLNKNYKLIRRVLIFACKEEKNLPEHFKKELDSMLLTVFSGIYFDYSTINEAKEELEKMNNPEMNEV